MPDKLSNGVKTKVDVAVLGNKLDNIDLKLTEFLKESRAFHQLIDKRVDAVEKTQERWKGIFAGGIMIVTAIFSIISLLFKYVF